MFEWVAQTRASSNSKMDVSIELSPLDSRFESTQEPLRQASRYLLLTMEMTTSHFRSPQVQLIYLTSMAPR